ncbi:MAG: M12 family metallo-peptidase [Planctomycetota bacterium]|jgi:hypothetical protein
MKTKNTLKRFGLILLLLFVLSAQVSEAAASAGPRTQLPKIFEQAPMPPEAASLMKVAPAPWVVKSEPKLVNLNLLVTSHAGDWLNLNLMPDASFLGVVERIKRRAQRRLTISGHLYETPDSSFIIVVNEDVAVGVIRTNLPNELYQIHYLGGGAHMVSRIDPKFYPPEEDASLLTNELKTPGEDESENDPGRYAEKSEAFSESCTQSEAVFDVLIAYTDLARQAMGGTNAAIAQCQLAIDVSNDAYDNSQIHARMRLVHTMEVSYNEPGVMQDWLDWLMLSSDVSSARETYRADFVCMLVSGGTGLGWCSVSASDAFSVERWGRAVNTWTLAHEIGHNQGCTHNREDDVDGCGLYSYSYGWHFIGDSTGHSGTVMSYMGTRIPHFSNPDILFDGQPTGVRIGETNEAHNAQTINLRRSECENFRLTRFDIWVDFNHSYPEVGTFALPYNSVFEGVSAIVSGVGASELPHLWVKAGSTSETVTISKAMTIRACGGTVTIGE